jgi:hypothetical protein
VGLAMKTEDEGGINEIKGKQKHNKETRKTGVYFYVVYLLLKKPDLRSIIYCDK